MKQLVTKGSLSVTDEGLISGIAWIFGEPDRTGDTIAKGSLAYPDTLPILWSHKDENAIGVWESIKETANGLEVKGRLLLGEIPLADRVFALIKSGAVRSLSVGFWPRKTDKNQHGGQHISDADLVEISIVSAPAHPGAQITSIKSATGRKGKHMAKATVKRTRKELREDLADNDNIEQIVEEVIEESTLEDRVTGLEDRVAAIEETVNGTSETVEEVNKSLKALVTKSGRPAIVRNVEKPADIKRKAFTAYLRQGERAPEVKTLVRGSDPKGGYVAPPEFVKELLRDIVEFSPVREHAYVGSTGNGSVIIPGRVGTTNAKWKGELETQEESTFDFREVEIPVHELNTYVDVSNQLLEDAEIDVEAEVRMAFAEDIGVKEGYAFVHGTGVKQPEGFMTRDDIAEYANGSTTDVDADALIGLLYSHPAYYRNEGAWLMNGTTLGKLRTLKDGQDNYLWQPSYQQGQPETILGRPVVELIDMPDVAANAVPIVYGDLREAYRIYDRIDMDVLVNPYARASEGVTRFHVRKRLGGGVVKPKALRKLVMRAS